MGKGRSAFRRFEAGVALLGVVAFLLVGPLRGLVASFPGLLPAATAVLVSIPGALLARWFLGGYFSGAALVPAAFVLGAGGFALLGVPMLLLHGTLGAYLLVCGLVVGASLVAAALLAFAGERWEPPGAPDGGRAGSGGGLMWVPFVGLTAALALVCRINAPSAFGDIWIYLSWTREFLSGGALATEEPYFGEAVGLSRASINGWLLGQAALSRVSGVEPVELVFEYLNPALAVVALLAVYALARVLFKNEKAALFCGCLYALFLLVDVDASRLSFGGEFVSRLAEDKISARYLFLPTALAFAAAFLDSGRRAFFWAFAFACCAVVVVHPIGFAIVGLSMAGFCALHLAANPRSRTSWRRVLGMGLAGVAVVAVPAVLLPAFTHESLTSVLADSDINSGDPDVLRNMIFVQPGRHRIFELPGGSYMMHASLILNPVIAAAYLLGLPFLLPRLKKSLAAQLLFGTLFLTAAVVYVPPVATFLGENVVLPGQIWRLAWPIPLAAVLTLGWLLYEAINRAGTWLRKRLPPGPTPAVQRSLPSVLPLLLVAVLTAAATPRAMEGARLVRDHAESARSSGLYPPDPIFPWFGREIASPTVVLAAEHDSVRIPAYAPEANVVSRRGVLVLQVLPALQKRAPGRIEAPPGALDVREFFLGTSLERGVEILRRNDVDLVMVESDSRLRRALDRLPGFTPLEEPSERYVVYSVNLRKLEPLVGPAQ